MVAAVISTILGAGVLLAGLIGCVIPVLPGPILGYASLIIVSLGFGWTVFPPGTLIALAVLTVVATVLDYLIPALMGKKYGASRAGTVGSVLGMLAGMVLFPPFGIIIGAFIGAVVGELAIDRTKTKESMRVGFGVVLGTLLNMLVKLSLTGIIAFFFVSGVVRRFTDGI